MAGATVGPLRSTWAWGFDWCQKPNVPTRSGLLVRVWSAIPPPSFHSTPPPHPYRKEDTLFQATHEGFKQFSQLDFSCWWTLHLESATPSPPFLLTQHCVIKSHSPPWLVLPWDLSGRRGHGALTGVTSRTPTDTERPPSARVVSRPPLPLSLQDRRHAVQATLEGLMVTT